MINPPEPGPTVPPEPVIDAPGAITAYFRRLEEAFLTARARTESSADRVCQLTDHQVRFRFAGKLLEPALTAALAHLPSARFEHGLDIICWDGTPTDAALPPPPWPWPAAWPACGFISPFGDPRLRVTLFPEIEAICLLRLDTNQAVFWIRDARSLTTQYLGSPLLVLFSWWAHNRGLNLVHAGCVGTERGAVLLVGKGGSGKSTTALLCAEAGLNYLSDDYCLVQISATPTAFSLYSSGKLHRDHLANFPGLAKLAITPAAEPHGKPVVYLGQASRFAVVPRQPLRAILVPAVTGRPDTSVEPTSTAAALRALAPSSLFQLPGTGPDSFHALARLARSLPCFRLNLGTRFDGIPTVIRGLINRL